MHSQLNHPGVNTANPRRRNVWQWVLLGGGFCVLLCSGVVGYVFYLGFHSPDTAVYVGNRVPGRFIEIMKSIGALEDGERLLYFYSDAMMDIRDGFYFVSDQKVVIYSKGFAVPLTAIGFDQIGQLDLVRNEALFEDSEITLVLKDDTIVSLPVSSEGGKD